MNLRDDRVRLRSILNDRAEVQLSLANTAFMKSDMGLLMNVVLGIVGAAIASAVFSLLGIAFAGWVGQLVVCCVHRRLFANWVVRALRGRNSVKLR